MCHTEQQWCHFWGVTGASLSLSQMEVRYSEGASAGRKTSPSPCPPASSCSTCPWINVWISARKRYRDKVNFFIFVVIIIRVTPGDLNPIWGHHFWASEWQRDKWICVPAMGGTGASSNPGKVWEGASQSHGLGGKGPLKVPPQGPALVQGSHPGAQ